MRVQHHFIKRHSAYVDHMKGCGVWRRRFDVGRIEKYFTQPSYWPHACLITTVTGNLKGIREAVIEVVKICSRYRLQVLDTASDHYGIEFYCRVITNSLRKLEDCLNPF